MEQKETVQKKRMKQNRGRVYYKQGIWKVRKHPSQGIGFGWRSQTLFKAVGRDKGGTNSARCYLVSHVTVLI